VLPHVKVGVAIKRSGRPEPRRPMTKRLLQASSLFGGAAAAVASTAASICCVGPLAIALLGVNGAILAAAFKPYRFYLLGASVVLLAAAFWSVYRGRRGCHGAGCPVRVGRWTKVVLWTALGLWIGAVVIQFLADRYWLQGGGVL
jgi:hypothetical protein